VKIAILGVGFLGSKLFDFLSVRYDIVCADLMPKYNHIEELDATNHQQVENFFKKERPNIVIDTIALSSYFECEKNPNLCRKLNFKTAKNISESCRKYASKMIFISSSYVFDGEKGEYDETDTPNSTNIYAKSKIDAERVVLSLVNSIVIRLEPIYGFHNEKNQLVFGTNTFENDIQVAFPELIRRPIFVDDVPRIISTLIKKNLSGIFNVAGPNKLKWYDFLLELSKLVDASEKIRIVEDSNWILHPPVDTSLKINKINLLGIHTTLFTEALEELKKFIN